MTTFGKYQLKTLLGKGGMAEIYLARTEGVAGFAKDLVIKRILPHLSSDPAFIAMFLDEARLAARLSHPCLAQIFELGEVDSTYYIAMEYVPGGNLATLSRKLAAHGLRMPLHYVAWILAKAASGLHYAHHLCDDAGEPLHLVHRDVSPENVMVTPQGAVKLIDFGVAKARERETQTVAGTVKGKFRYMSPEQIQAQPLDGRSDIFSLGIVLYELSTLARPFGDGPDLVTVTSIVKDPPTPPSVACAGYPPRLEAIVLKALAKDPAERYRTAQELQADLETFVHSRGTFLSAQEVGDFVSRVLAGGEADIAALRDLPSGVRTAIDHTVVPAQEPTLVVSPPSPVTSRVTSQDRAPAPAPPTPTRRGKVVAAAAGALALVAFAVAAAFLWPGAPAPSGSGDAPLPTAAVVAVAPPPVAPPTDVGGRRAPQEEALDRQAPEPVAPSPDVTSDTGRAAAPADVAAPVPPVPRDVAADTGRAPAPPDVAAAPVPRPDAAAPPTAVPPVVEPEVGFLAIHAAPGSWVEIDGRKHAFRPRQRIQLAPGTYRLQVREPEALRNYRTTVRITAGQTVSVRPQ